MELEFRAVQPEDAAWAAPSLLAANKRICEYAFTTAYLWSEYYRVSVARVGDTPVFRSEWQGEYSYLPPVGEGAAAILRELYAAAQAAGQPLRLHSVDEETLTLLRTLFPARVHARESDADFDYLYRTADLATLAGRAYHSKKSHIAAFSRAHAWTYEPLSADNVEDMIAMSRRWCEERGGCEQSLHAERCGIRRILRQPERFSLRGGLLRVEGVPVAVTLGSPGSDTVFDIHVEKALSAYAGAYAVINREFAATLGDFTYLNRENDMGIEGLRRAKHSYRPVAILKKYQCTVG